jgi:mevalonate pyrophosphate decarboxylase
VQDGKVSKILTIVPTDDENEVELRVYNYKVQDDSLYLEGKNVKIKNLEKIKDVVKSLETYVEAESKFLSDWSKL